MAKIPTYENKLFPDPSPLVSAAKGAETSGYYIGNMERQGWNELGRGVQSLYEFATKPNELDKQKAAADKLKAQEEVSGLAGDSAQANADLTVAWQSKMAAYDPGNKEDTTAQDFLDKDFHETWDKIGQGLTTDKARQNFEKMKAKSFAHFFMVTNSDISAQKGKWAVDKANSISTSTSAAITADPTSWKSLVDQANTGIDALDDAHGFGVNKKNELKAKWDHEFALAAAQQIVQDDPAAGADLVNKGEFDGFLNAGEKATLLKRAESRAHEVHQGELTQAAAERKQRIEEAHSQLNELQNQYITENPNGTFTVSPEYNTKLDALVEANKDVLTPTEVRSARRFAAMETRRSLGQLKPTTHNDDATDTQLFTKLTDGTLTKEELDTAHTDGKITTSTWKSYREKLLKPKKENREEVAARNYLTSFESMIGKTFPSADLGTPTAMQYREDMLAAREGKTLTEWKQYASQQAPLYFSGHEHAKQIIQDHVQKQIDAGASKAPNPGLARQPGESAEDYLKRRGLK